MPRENYQERLNELRTDVVAMGDLVLDRYETALRAAETGDDPPTRSSAAITWSTTDTSNWKRSVRNSSRSSSPWPGTSGW